MSDVVVRIRFDDQQGVVKGIDQITGETDELESSLQSAGWVGSGAFDGIAAAAGIAIGVISAAGAAAAGFVHEMNGVAEIQDRIAKESQRLGVPVEILSSYRLAAELTGTSVETMARGIKTLEKNAFDAAQGVGEAREIFQAFNIDLEDGQGKLRSANDLLLDFADRFVLIEDDSLKAAVAQRVFGRAGIELVPLLNRGRDGISELIDKARELGIVFTAETAAQAEAYNDSIAKIEFAIEGLKFQLANEFFPLATRLTDETVILVQTTGVSLATFLDSTLGDVLINKVSGKVQELQILLRTATKTVDLFALSTGPGGAAATVLAALISARAEVEAEFRAASETQVQAHLDFLADAQRRQMELLGNLPFEPGESPLDDSLQMLLDKLRDIREGTDEASKGVGALFERGFRGGPLPPGGPTAPRATVDPVRRAEILGLAPPPTPDQEANTLAGFGIGIQPPSTQDIFPQQAPESPGFTGIGTPGVASPPDISPWQEFEADFGDITGNLTDKFGLYQSAIEGAGQAVELFVRGQASLGQAVQAAVKNSIASLAAEAAVHSIRELALGFASLTVWGAPVFGPAAPHFKSAALWGLVAGAAGGAGRAIGGTGGVAGSAGGFGAFPAASQGGPAFVDPLRNPNQFNLSDVRVGQESNVERHLSEISASVRGLGTAPADHVVTAGVQRAGGVSGLLTGGDIRNITQQVVNDPRF